MCKHTWHILNFITHDCRGNCTWARVRYSQLNHPSLQRQLYLSTCEIFPNFPLIDRDGHAWAHEMLFTLFCSLIEITQAQCLWYIIWLQRLLKSIQVSGSRETQNLVSMKSHNRNFKLEYSFIMIKVGYSSSISEGLKHVICASTSTGRKGCSYWSVWTTYIWYKALSWYSCS